MTLELGKLHSVPQDIRGALKESVHLKEVWNTLTPLARNEWICFVVSCKKEETRRKRIERFCDDLNKGKRRPCCFAGCPHRF